jgi:hypothetical protein
MNALHRRYAVAALLAFTDTAGRHGVIVLPADSTAGGTWWFSEPCMSLYAQSPASN